MRKMTEVVSRQGKQILTGEAYLGTTPVAAGPRSRRGASGLRPES